MKTIKEVRKGYKESGTFYTPPALAEKLAQYLPKNPKNVYDPTCGSGNLLSVFPDETEKYGQEISQSELNLISLPNFHGYCGDTLTDDGFTDLKFECIVANPPFSLKWNPDAVKNDPRFTQCPWMAPPSKADWAFMLHILYHLNKSGKAAILSFPGILYRGGKEGQIRKWFIEKNYIDRVVNIPGGTFEDTSIATCVVILDKNKERTSITLEDIDREREVPLQEIKDNGYTLSVQTYLPVTVVQEEIDINAVNKEIALGTVQNVERFFELAKMLEEVNGDYHYAPEVRGELKKILEKYPGEEKLFN